MPLLNYTTSVEAHQTVSQVHRLLAKAGASHIATEYTGGTPSGVAFVLNDHAFTLPVRIDAVAKVLARDRTLAPRYRTEIHAERVAWRIAKDWLEAQLAIVATEMVSFEQVMLPYLRSSTGVTMWELYQRGLLPALDAGGNP